ncbi:hypothetical protein CesoFtcFv8_003447 [Champsocephalus esox]|uniref:Uncharacterized protein n=1 Tax=Champsocephalus esox TaxID=159716 RepID=A0AAN8CTW2_9TELE|nr:hypothetical protein CesoFtcFv8_003447 [Champsocephalus esox]
MDMGEKGVAEDDVPGSTHGLTGEEAASRGKEAVSGGKEAVSGGEEAASGGEEAASGGEEAASGGEEAASGGEDATVGVGAALVEGSGGGRSVTWDGIKSMSLLKGQIPVHANPAWIFDGVAA